MRAILTFHSIDSSRSVLSFPLEKFRRLLEYTRAVDLPVLDLEQLLSGSNSRGISITFDDGFRSVLTHALPVLKEYSAPCHLFLCTATIDSRAPPSKGGHTRPDSDMLSWADLECLAASGVAIDSHSTNHLDMRDLTDAQIMEECESADEVIMERLNCRPRFFAYPFGFHNGQVRNYVRNRYKAAVTTEMRELGRHEDSAALPRLDSYYLQPDWVLSNPDCYKARSYYRLRCALRNLAGSQCRAGSS